MKISIPTQLRRGFTLIELLVAMTITAMLVYIIMQMTSQGIDIWKSVNQDVETSSRARVAMRAIANDFESMQIRHDDNDYQWFYSKTENVEGGGPKGLKIPKSAQMVFFTSAIDRNPAVSSSESLRESYREARNHNIDTQGDINAVGYRLMFRDQILNIDGKDKNAKGSFPLFALYRQLVPPRKAFDDLLGQTNLEQAYVSYEQDDQNYFLCENIIEMSLILDIQSAQEQSSAKDARPSYETISVPIIGSNSNNAKVAIFGDRIEINATKYENARVVSANISVTVVTEEGMHLINQVHHGRRIAPKPAEFFQRYTRSFAHRVSLPSSF